MAAKALVPISFVGTVDIECGDWDRYQLGVVCDADEERVYYDGDEMIDDLRRRGGMYFAHGGGVYDLLFVLERARVRGIPCQVDRSQHRVTRIVMGKLTLRDSYSLWPASLAELCGAIGMAVPELPWPCICGAPDSLDGKGKGIGRGCGGYCQIEERARRRDPALEDYCKADARALYLVLRHLFAWAADHKIVLRGTIGQTAWIAAQSDLGIPDSSLPYHLWRHARQADKGGRIAVVRPRVGLIDSNAIEARPWLSSPGPIQMTSSRPSSSGVVGAHHDICNAYPAQLAKAELPVGACRELGDASAERALQRCMPGVYTVSITVPDDQFLPPLPWHKAGQLCFPTGEFSGTWALPELVAAFERGVKLRQVHTALVWEATAPIFAPLIERWYAIRKSVGRKTPLGHWLGGAAKALTGKLAERPDRQRVTFHPERGQIKVCLRTGPCRDGCTKRCGAYEQLDLYGHVWGIPYHRLSASAYPQWSAYLRAMTRVQWLSQAERMGDGGRDVCLGNTDSLWHTSRQTPEPLGDDLGYWEYQHSWTDLEVRAPTIYAFRDPADPSGRLQTRGIPGITEDDWRRGAGTIDRGIVTLGKALKTSGGLFRKRSRKWALPKQDRVWFGDRKLATDGLTYPATADELRALQKSIDGRRRIRRK
jgi:hypothetical protein